MGWQDRDWAKLDDEELNTLYGARRVAAFPTRRVVWAVVAVVVAFGAFAVTHREHPPIGSPSLVAPTAAVIYGTPETFVGQPAACTDYQLGATGQWQCFVVQQTTGAQRVARAAPYDGPCAHLSADQTTGRWVCLSTRPTSGG
jgi:hypothetical protein